MKSEKRVLATIGIGIVIVLGFFFITEAITKYTGFFVASDNSGDDFNKCLEEQNINLYINTNELVQTLENIKLFDYLQYFKITNCLRNNQGCLNNGVSSFPTWIINNEKMGYDIGLEKLKESSGCVGKIE